MVGLMTVGEAWVLELEALDVLDDLDGGDVDDAGGEPGGRMADRYFLIDGGRLPPPRFQNHQAPPKTARTSKTMIIGTATLEVTLIGRLTAAAAPWALSWVKVITLV